jgi:transposase
MQVLVSVEEAAVLAQAAARERRVRRWRRLRAIQVLGSGASPTRVATMLACSLARVYNWAAAWRAAGLAGVQDLPRPGKARALDQRAEQWLDEWLASAPQGRGDHATGWTVPRLTTEVARAGYEVGERTIRRTRTRRGWRWTRPTYVLGRPDPE